MAKNFIGFRPGKKDTAIIEDLQQYKNQSARIRELLLLGMAVERGEYVRATDIPKVLVARDIPPEKSAEFKAQWDLVQGGAVRPAAPHIVPYEQLESAAASEDDDEIRRNMISGFE